MAEERTKTLLRAFRTVDIIDSNARGMLEARFVDIGYRCPEDIARATTFLLGHNARTGATSRLMQLPPDVLVRIVMEACAVDEIKQERVIHPIHSLDTKVPRGEIYGFQFPTYFGMRAALARRMAALGMCIYIHAYANKHIQTSNVFNGGEKADRLLKSRRNRLTVSLRVTKNAQKALEYGTTAKRLRCFFSPRSMHRIGFSPRSSIPYKRLCSAT
jgi:hypothetical protein